MTNQKDILYELEISCSILRTSINALAKEWGVSHTHVRQVAKGITKSSRIRDHIDKTIREAKQIVPFNTENNS